MEKNKSLKIEKKYLNFIMHLNYYGYIDMSPIIKKYCKNSYENDYVLVKKVVKEYNKKHKKFI